ncbi:sigma 54-interacting transcriptional regulator [Cellulosilyticum sp. I15G10I2]|uniref:sigma 54-interacting transcriptional regulator n=1 Tax=Cellulosilyticum sp. I15G10I2 TaxID=1892843 RepID=UPI00085C492E|nr:sigma 54-interacting transcriptional regulator [Cellulosilyticum sp. I15G10I2]
MKNIAFIVPRDEMLLQAAEVIKEEGLEVHTLKVVKTADVVSEARKVIADGVDLIVARGMQASLIKSYTNVPVVEICLTSQEIGRLIVRAKKILQKAKPRIGIIGFPNMFCDMTYFNDIFDIELHRYLIKESDETQEAVNKALADKVELLIGGEMTVVTANIVGIPALFLESTKDSIRQATQIAKNMNYAREIEKKHNAHMEALVGYSFSGILKLNQSGVIIVANHMMQEILGKRCEDIIGKHIGDVLDEIDFESIESVLSAKKESYSSFLRINNMALIIMAVPIQVDDEVEGAIISCHKVQKLEQMESQALREMYLHGYVAQSNFTQILRKSKEMKEIIELAKLFAQTKNPVLIYGEVGTEKELFAQSIHNNSVRKNAPFISINCNGMSEEMQTTVLFGNNYADNGIEKQKGALEIGNYGTVLIHEIEQLTMHCQYRLFKAIKYKTLIQNDIEKTMTLDVKVVATSRRNLSVLVKKGLFREDLYYALNALSFEIPPLRKTQEDIEILLNEYTKAYAAQYERYIVLTTGAKKMIYEYQWEGNLIQLESFCERMVLTAPRRTVDENFVRYLLGQLYPIIRQVNDEEKVVVYKAPEGAIIAELLEKHKGNRELVAQELNISKTTLWRHMKKYGVSNKYDI